MLEVNHACHVATGLYGKTTGVGYIVNKTITGAAATSIVNIVVEENALDGVETIFCLADIKDMSGFCFSTFERCVGSVGVCEVDCIGGCNYTVGQIDLVKLIDRSGARGETSIDHHVVTRCELYGNDTCEQCSISILELRNSSLYLL